MRILLATPLYPPEIGGPATHAQFVAAELSKRAHVIDLLPFARVRKYPKVVRHIAYFFLLLWRGWRCDVVYALDPVSVGVPASAAAFLLRKRFVLRVAGDYAWEQGVGRFGVTDDLEAFLGGVAGAAPITSASRARRAYPLSVRFFQWVQCVVASRAERVVVPSQYFKTVIVRWGIAPKKISVIYSTLDPVEYLTKEAARTKLGVGSSPLLVSAGRLVKWKGFLALLDAFALVVREYPEAQLRIIGSGPEQRAIEQKIAKLKLNSSVLLEGQLSQQDLHDRVAAADVFVLNTHYEGLSHQLIEVMQIGTPIVTTAVGGNGELIVDGVSGLLCAPDAVPVFAASIVRVVRDAKFATRLRRGARQALAPFDPQQSLTALDTLFLTPPPKRRQIHQRAGDVVVGRQQTGDAASATGLRVLMLSGDAHALSQGSGVYKRLLLQAQEVGWLEVYVRGASRQLPLGSHGIVRGFAGSKPVVAWRMYRQGARLRPEVVTAQDPFLLGLIGWCIAKKVHAALQLQIHTNLFVPEYQAQHHLNVRLARRLLPKAQGVRVVTEQIATAMRTQVPGIAVSILPVCIDAVAVAAAPESKLFAAYKKIKTRILIAARLEEEKRVNELLRNLVPLLRAYPKAGVFIAGDGSQKVALQALAASLGITDRVVFLGFRHDVYSLYKSADLVLAATAAYEGYGASTVEALLAGAPVLSLDVGIARAAGATIYTPETFVAQATAILEQGARGSLAMPLVSPESWALHWSEGIAACAARASTRH